MSTLHHRQALVFFQLSHFFETDIHIYLPMTKKTSKYLECVKTNMVLLDGHTHGKENQGKYMKQKVIQNVSKP